MSLRSVARGAVCLLLVLSPLAGFAGEDEAEPRERGFLGVTLDGTTIRVVQPETPAARAGLEPGDVLVAVDDAEIGSIEDLRAVLADRYAGDEIALRVRRGEEVIEKTVVLAPRPKAPAGSLPPGVQLPPGVDLPPEILERLRKRMRQPIDAPRHYEHEGEVLGPEESLRAGLGWLAAQQEEDGKLPAGEAYPGYPQRFHVAVTSLGGLALLLDPAFEEAAEKALSYVLSCSHDDGYLYDSSPSFKGMWEHGFGTLFLAEMLRHQRAQGEDTTDLEAALRKAVALIERVQNLDGGWGYRALPDPHAEVGPGAAMLDALLLARRVGVPVQERTIRRALKSQAALMLPPRPETVQGEWRSFSYEANAFVLASLLGWKERPDTAVYLEALESVAPEAYFRAYTETTVMNGVYWATGNHTLGLLYSALAFRRLGEAHADAFGAWHADVAARLAEVQRADGAFKGWFGDVYGTAFACLTLGARSDRLAWFHAAAGTPTEAPAGPAGEGAPPALDETRALRVTASLQEASTRHRWSGLEATVEGVGLQAGRTALPAALLRTLLPTSGPLTPGRRWAVPAGTVARLFQPFHETVRGRMEAEVVGREGDRVDVALRALVKFGPESGSHVLTTSFSGTMQLDAAAKRITALDLDTISGCIRVKQSQAGRSTSYVALNDIDLEVHGRDAEAGALPAAPEGAEDAPRQPAAGRGVDVGLLDGTFEVHEAPATTREEVDLGLRPVPGTSAQRPYWLFVPEAYDPAVLPPLLVVLHRRSRLGSYRSGQAFGAQDLERYAKRDLESWRQLAEEEGCLLALPLGDVDILHMGLSWQTREHTRLLDALLESVGTTHAFDPTRVYLAAQGEGAHAALATALRRGEAVAAVTLANPPLFDGESRIPWGSGGKRTLVLPEPVPDLLAEASARKVPVLLLAGNVDTELDLDGHAVSSLPDCSRYQDTSKIPSSHLKRMAGLLEKAGHKVRFEEFEGRHVDPFPRAKVKEAWSWLRGHRLPSDR